MVLAALIGVSVFVVSGVLFTLAGAFSFRMALGVGTYRSSGTYIGVIAAGILGALVLSVTSVWYFLESRRA